MGGTCRKIFIAPKNFCDFWKNSSETCSFLARVQQVHEYGKIANFIELRRVFQVTIVVVRQLAIFYLANDASDSCFQVAWESPVLVITEVFQIALEFNRSFHVHRFFRLKCYSFLNAFVQQKQQSDWCKNSKLKFNELHCQFLRLGFNSHFSGAQLQGRKHFIFRWS